MNKSFDLIYKQYFSMPLLSGRQIKSSRYSALNLPKTTNKVVNPRAVTRAAGNNSVFSSSSLDGSSSSGVISPIQSDHQNEQRHVTTPLFPPTGSSSHSYQVLIIPGGGGGYSHIWAIRVSAAQQGMVFASLTLEQGIKIALSLWNRVYFISGLTLE